MSKVMLCLLWFCFTLHSDWLKRLAPLSEPIRSKTKTDCDLLAHIFPHLTLITCTISDWFILFFVPVVIGLSDYFGIGFTTLI